MDRKFRIQKYHHSLKFILELEFLTGVQSKWLSKLQEFDGAVEFKPRRLKLTTDRLSKVLTDEEELDLNHLTLYPISVVHRDWMQAGIYLRNDDPFYRDITLKMQKKDTPNTRYQTGSGIIYYKGIVLISVECNKVDHDPKVTTQIRSDLTSKRIITTTRLFEYRWNF